MKNVIYFTNNNSETLEQLESLGIKICPCCKFHNTKWIRLHINPIKEKIINVHGVGYGCESECEGMCSEKCIICSVKDVLYFNNNVLIFSDINDLINYLKEKVMI